MRTQTLLILSATSALARPQTAVPVSGDNGEMGGLFGMGVTATIPPWASSIGSALSSFASSSGLSSLMGSIDTNALIGKIVPAGPEYPKGKMTLADFYDPGSGPYPAHFVTEAALANHTIYKPKTPPANGIKMPVLIWGNGGCTSSGTPYAPFLTEVASHGYICIANGPPGGAPPSLDLPKEAGGILPGPNGEKLYSKETMTGGNGFAKIKDMLDAIDWVVKGNAAKYGNVDLDNFITAGSSCGGLEAYSAAYHNDRVKLVGVYNSGVLDAKKKPLLKEFKAKIAYFQGGPLDPGYANVSFSAFCIYPSLHNLSTLTCVILTPL
jgi:hypothetical protein